MTAIRPVSTRHQPEISRWRTCLNQDERRKIPRWPVAVYQAKTTT